MYMQNRNRLTDIENKPVVTKGEKEEGRDKLGALTDTNYYIVCIFGMK